MLDLGLLQASDRHTVDHGQGHFPDLDVEVAQVLAVELAVGADVFLERDAAVSQDAGPRASVEAFLAKLKVEDLGAYQDSKMALSGSLGPDVVLPTSILYDAEGREVWRYVGDLDWTSPEAARLLAEGAAPKAR